MNYSIEEQITITQEKAVLIWWFPKNFSQERIGETYTGSNACTAIILLVAMQWNELAIEVEYENTGSFIGNLVKVLENSITKGNKVHQRFIDSNKLKEVNLTVPESITAIGPEIKHLTEWQSTIFLMDLGETLYSNLTTGIKDWEIVRPNYEPELFVILIADNHCVLFVFQENQNKVLLIDTHDHGDKGAVASSVPQSELKELCYWYNSLLKDCYQSQPSCYELSYFYFKRTRRN